VIYQQDKLTPWAMTPSSSDSGGLYDAHVHIEIADRRLGGVFAAAQERRLLIMIHAGVGDPAVGTQTLQRAKGHPEARLILVTAPLAPMSRWPRLSRSGAASRLKARKRGRPRWGRRLLVGTRECLGGLTLSVSMGLLGYQQADCPTASRKAARTMLHWYLDAAQRKAQTAARAIQIGHSWPSRLVLCGDRSQPLADVSVLPTAYRHRRTPSDRFRVGGVRQSWCSIQASGERSFYGRCKGAVRSESAPGNCGRKIIEVGLPKRVPRRELIAYLALHPTARAVTS
jgi:hypothetical protein